MRNRYHVIFALIAVIGFGLASRKFPGLFPELLGNYPGDALWAIAVYLGWTILLPNTHSMKLMVLALTTSFLVELSQLHNALWLDQIRSNAIGHLFLGSTFNPIDLIAYLSGVLLVFLADLFLHKRRMLRVHSV